MKKNKLCGSPLYAVFLLSAGFGLALALPTAVADDAY